MLFFENSLTIINEEIMLRKTMIMAILVIAQAIYGCSTLQTLSNIQSPDLAVKNLDIANADLEEMDLVLNIQVNNHYPIGIHLPAFDYHFQVNENAFLKGSTTLNQSISAKHQNIVKVPVRIHFMDLYQSLGNLLNQDQAAYQLSGNIHVDVPILGRLKMPFEKKGQLPLLKMPKISVKGLRVKSLNFATANLSLDIEMDNPNGFLMLLNNFSYNFAVDGLKWADGQISKDMSFQKHGNSQISIPIALNFFEMGKTLFNVIKNKRALPYEFNTHLQFQTDLPFLQKVDIPVKKEGKVPFL